MRALAKTAFEANAKALLDLAQGHNAAVRRQQTTVEFRDDGVAGDRLQARQRQRRISHGGGGLTEMARIGYSITKSYAKSVI